MISRFKATWTPQTMVCWTHAMSGILDAWRMLPASLFFHQWSWQQYILCIYIILIIIIMQWFQWPGLENCSCGLRWHCIEAHVSAKGRPAHSGNQSALRYFIRLVVKSRWMPLWKAAGTGSFLAKLSLWACFPWVCLNYDMVWKADWFSRILSVIVHWFHWSLQWQNDGPAVGPAGEVSKSTGQCQDPGLFEGAAPTTGRRWKEGYIG